jgi:hypothetical protein
LAAFALQRRRPVVMPRSNFTEAVRWLEHMRDVGITIDPTLFSEAEQLRRIWGASLGTARRNEKARQQRLKEQRQTSRRNRSRSVDQ